MFDVSLQLLCTRKSGTLSRIIREFKLFGLQYQNHKIDFDDDNSRITINAIGDLNCPLDSLEELFDNFPEVLQVLQLNVTEDGKDITQFKTKVSEALISSKEHLTPAVLLAAEKRLSDILGPVAAFIVESASQDCSNAGELYSRLAEELNDQGERDYFLSVIESGS